MTSATDELRRLLDERGVEYRFNESTKVFEWHFGGTDGEGSAHATEVDGGINIMACSLTPEQAIAATLGEEINGDTSDGYHTFNELYHHRAVLFSVIVASHRGIAWKSKLHHDGTMYDGMFIVGIETPKGQATYHYDLDPYWDMFDCRVLDRAPEWDGHTPDEAIARIAELGRGTCRIEHRGMGYYCSECGAMVGSDDVTSELHIDANAIELWDFCPRCGAKVVQR